MTLFITLGLVGIGAEGIWPVFQLRLLIAILGVEFGGYKQGQQAALAQAAKGLRAKRTLGEPGDRASQWDRDATDALR